MAKRSTLHYGQSATAAARLRVTLIFDKRAMLDVGYDTFWTLPHRAIHAFLDGLTVGPTP